MPASASAPTLPRAQPWSWRGSDPRQSARLARWGAACAAIALALCLHLWDGGARSPYFALAALASLAAAAGRCAFLFASMASDETKVDRAARRVELSTRHALLPGRDVSRSIAFDEVQAVEARSAPAARGGFDELSCFLLLRGGAEALALRPHQSGCEEPAQLRAAAERLAWAIGCPLQG